MPHKDPTVRAQYFAEYRRKNRDALLAYRRQYEKSPVFMKKRNAYMCRADIKEKHRLARSFPAAKEKLRARQWKHKYALSTQARHDLYADQGGRCGVCDKPLEEFSRNTHIDHDHRTGAIRGLLCTRCNCGLAFVEDTDFRVASLRYLEKRHGPA